MSMGLTHFRQRARTGLLSAPLSPEDDAARFGDHTIAGTQVPPGFFATARHAAVLVPVVARPEGPTLLLTERAAHLKTHAGQVAFPGGRVEPAETVEAAALREAREEIGLEAGHAETLGYLPPYFSGTGFRVQPVVAVISPQAQFTPDAGEVARVFEVPLDVVLDLGRYRSSTIYWKGQERLFYILDHESAYIWGVTAGILRTMAERF